MTPDPIRQSGQGLDLSSRIVESTSVVASPSAATETIIAQTAALTEEQIVSGVSLSGWAAFTVGTNGTSVRLRIRQTNASGTTIADTGLVDAGIAAAKLVSLAVQGKDTSPAASAQVYVLTLTVTAGSAASTVSATSLRAIAV